VSHHLEKIHMEGENDPRFNMPYTPAIKVRGGRTVYVAGVTAAPVYHTHPHVASEFDDLPEDPGTQAEMAIENLRRVLRAAGGDLGDIVAMSSYIKDMDRNQDAITSVIGRAMGDHRPTSTLVEVVRLAASPKLLLELTATAVVADEGS
jgi:enamine deaminase RidA (YjgF/YER057c/UK114 family)